MQKNEIHRASSLLTKLEALVGGIKHLRDMADRIVTGTTKVQVAIHLCDMDKKAALANRMESEDAMNRLNNGGFDGIVVMGKNDKPEDALKKFMKDAVEERKKMEAETCLDFQETVEEDESTTVIVALIRCKEAKKKAIEVQLKELGVEF